MRIAQCFPDARRLTGDWKLVGEPQRGDTRSLVRERRSVDVHFVIVQPPEDRAGKDFLDECVLLKHQALAHHWRSELLENFARLWCLVEVVPCRHGSDELHESQPIDEARAPPCQLECECRTRSDEHTSELQSLMSNS